MKRTFILLITFPIVFVLLLGAVTNRESWTEINAATGAMRSRTTHALFFAEPWAEQPTWISERAAQLGIDTQSDWQVLSHRELKWGIATRGCGRAPAAYTLRYTDESVISQEEQDVFVRSFAKADEGTREKMIRELNDASHRP